MGSFNLRCFASGQVIASGDKCHAILTVQSSSFRARTIERSYIPFNAGKFDESNKKTETLTRESYCESDCYTNGHWNPRSLFIAGTYDDYGKVIPDLSNVVTRCSVMALINNLRNIRENYSVVKSDYYPGFDLAKYHKEELEKLLPPKGSSISSPELDEYMLKAWDYIWEGHQAGVLFGSPVSGRGVAPMAFAVMHDKAYEELLTIIGAKLASKTSELHQEVLEKCKSQAEEYVSTYSKQEDGDRKRYYYLDGFFNELKSNMSNSDIMPSPQLRGLVSDILDSYHKTLSNEELLSRLSTVINMLLVISGLNYLNIKLSPVVTASQDYLNRSGLAYSNFVNKVSKKILNERLCDDDGYRAHFTVMGKYLSDNERVRVTDTFLLKDSAFEFVSKSFNPSLEFGFEYKVSTFLDEDVVKEQLFNELDGLLQIT